MLSAGDTKARRKGKEFCSFFKSEKRREKKVVENVEVADVECDKIIFRSIIYTHNNKCLQSDTD